MTEQEIPRSIRLPKTLWNALDEDARRCRRSAVKQLEAILTVYYDLENVELDQSRLDKAGRTPVAGSVPNGEELVNPRVPVLNIKLKNEKGEAKRKVK